MKQRITLFVTLALSLLVGCDRKVTVGPFRIPRSAEATVRLNDRQPDSALITTSQGNQLVMRIFPKTDRYAADYLNIPNALSRYIAALPKSQVRWIRGLAHDRADGVRWFQVDYRRVNESPDISAPEVISMYRWFIFKDHLVRFDGLLIEGDQEKDFQEVDRITKWLTIRE